MALVTYVQSGSFGADLKKNRFEAAAHVLLGISQEFLSLEREFHALFSSIEQWKQALYAELSTAASDKQQSLYEFIDDFTYLQSTFTQKKGYIDTEMMRIGLESKDFFTNQASIEAHVISLVSHIESAYKSKELLNSTLEKVSSFLSTYAPQARHLQLFKLAQVKDNLVEALEHPTIADAKTWWNDLYALAKDKSLGCVNLSGRDLSEHVFSSAIFDSRSQLSKANLRKAQCQYIHARAVNLSESNLDSANFSHAQLELADIDGASARLVDFSHANLREGNLAHAQCLQANFSNADLSYSTARDASFVKALFKDALLVGVDFRGAELTDADFSGANVSGARFTSSFDKSRLALAKHVNEAVFE